MGERKEENKRGEQQLEIKSRMQPHQHIRDPASPGMAHAGSLPTPGTKHASLPAMAGRISEFRGPMQNWNVFTHILPAPEKQPLQKGADEVG